MTGRFPAALFLGAAMMVAGCPADPGDDDDVVELLDDDDDDDNGDDDGEGPETVPGAEDPAASLFDLAVVHQVEITVDASPWGLAAVLIAGTAATQVQSLPLPAPPGGLSVIVTLAVSPGVTTTMARCTTRPSGPRTSRRCEPMRDSSASGASPSNRPFTETRAPAWSAST